VVGNGDQQWFIDHTYAPTASVRPWTVSNGVLSITTAKADPAIKPYINNYEYTSGLITNYPSFSQTYGYFEMSAQLPKGQGLWPAFWLLPTSGAWPPEIDILEVLGNDLTTLYTFAHSSALTGSHTYIGGSHRVTDMSVGFHTYGLNWQADYLTWYFDGVEIQKLPTPSDMNVPMSIIANLTVGSYWPGPVNSTTPFPSSFEIDYIRAYQDLGAAPPTPPSSPPPPPPEPPTAPPPPEPSTPPATGGGRRIDRADRNDRGDRGDTGGTVGGTLNGSDANDTLTGGRSADAINGAGGDDVLRGGAGIDTLNGGEGHDRLFGDAGADTLTGGLGNDVFAYATAVSAKGDIIADFGQNGQADRIDLSAIDRGVLLFIAAATTTVSSHSVNWYESGSNTIVQADVNGRVGADFQVTLLGTGLNLTADDFVL
jgi:hypothetical protein